MGSGEYTAISSDGGSVAFDSHALNLVPDDSNGERDVFVKDMSSGATQRCSTSSLGGEGNGSSGNPSISADGRYVAFNSEADNLVQQGLTGVFRKDTHTNDLCHCGNGIYPSINSDGRYVAYFVEARYSIFQKDLETGEVVDCATSNSGEEANSFSHYPSISSSGRYTAFQSLASNLVPDDANGVRDVFRKDVHPAIISVSTSAESQGWSGNVAITATRSSFDHVNFPTTSEADFGSGVNVNSLTVADSTHATANITISGEASPGTRDVNVTTGEETPDPLSGGFTVRDPKTTTISPDSAAQGQRLNVQVTGSDTTFQDGLSSATFSGGGITVNSTKVTDSTHATADITVSGGASPGGRDVNVITGEETPDALPGGFTVRDAKIDSVSPESATRGQRLDVEITGTDTAFQDGLSSATFSGGDITVNSVKVEDATHATANITVSSDAEVGTRDVNVKTGGETPDKLSSGFTVKLPKPHVSGISENQGPISTQVTVKGENFGDEQGLSRIKFNKADATPISWSDTEITTRVPTDAESGEMTVTTGGGVSNGVNFTVTEGTPEEPPVPDPQTYYFAEGTTREGFSEYLCVSNPGQWDTSVTITYMMENGENQVQGAKIEPESRFTVNVGEVVGPGRDLSIRVDSDRFVVAERPMYFARTSHIGPTVGGHVVVGATETSKEWHFAEGCTRTTPRAFEEYICVLNPNEEQATVQFAFMTSEGENPTHVEVIPPRSRYTIVVSDVVGLEKDVSASVISDVPVVAERPIYFNYGGWIGGHDSLGLNQGSKEFYFAEGCTRVDTATGMQFSEWISVQNPGEEKATVDITFMLETGDEIPHQVILEPVSRQTVSVAQVVGWGHDVCTRIISDVPIIAERPMYFAIGELNGGHDVMGSTAPGSDYFFAEGTTRSGFEEWISIMNPGEKTALVTMYFNTTEGENLTSQVLVEPHSRETLSARERVGAEKDISVRVVSNEPILVERPMYFNFEGFNGGHVVEGWEVPSEVGGI